jgi:hypothetical protein
MRYSYFSALFSDPRFSLGNLADFFPSLPWLFVAAVCAFLPMFLFGSFMVRRKRRYLAEANEPFTERPLRPAGESLRVRIEQLDEEQTENVVGLFLASFMAFVFMALAGDQRLPLFIAASIVLAGAMAFFGRRLCRWQTERWDHVLGYAGERVVGEALNQLLSRGYRVFHDLPFDGFNIDHAIVGPDGVFCIETKTRRKRADTKGQRRARVTYDGESLVFPWGAERFGLEQAQRNATTLAKWLTQATGEFTPVSPVLVLPGWFVDLKTNKPVVVLNEKQIAKTFPIGAEQRLSPARIQRIAFQLESLCRMSAPDKGAQAGA